jgi:hypothetical protein
MESIMSTAEMMGQITKASPRFRAKFVGVYYLLTILTGAFVLFFHGRSAFAADLIAAVFYIAVTTLFYDLSKPANKSDERNQRGRGMGIARQEKL